MKSMAWQATPTPVLDLLPSLLTTKTNRPRGLGVALVPSVNAPHSATRVTFHPLRDGPKEHGIGIAIAHRTADELAPSLRFRELIGQLADEQAGIPQQEFSWRGRSTRAA